MSVQDDRIEMLEKRVEHLEQFVQDLLVKMERGIQIAPGHNIPGVSYHGMEKLYAKYATGDNRKPA